MGYVLKFLFYAPLAVMLFHFWRTRPGTDDIKKFFQEIGKRIPIYITWYVLLYFIYKILGYSFYDDFMWGIGDIFHLSKDGKIMSSIFG